MTWVLMRPAFPILDSLVLFPMQVLMDPGIAIRIWKFNITRYVQHVLTKTLPHYDFRLIAPFYVIEEYGLPPTVPDVTRTLFVNPTVAKGRVRLAGNTGYGDSNPQRIRLQDCLFQVINDRFHRGWWINVRKTVPISPSMLALS